MKHTEKKNYCDATRPSTVHSHTIRMKREFLHSTSFFCHAHFMKNFICAQFARCLPSYIINVKLLFICRIWKCLSELHEQLCGNDWTPIIYHNHIKGDCVCNFSRLFKFLTYFFFFGIYFWVGMAKTLENSEIIWIFFLQDIDGLNNDATLYACDNCKLNSSSDNESSWLGHAVQRYWSVT